MPYVKSFRDYGFEVGFSVCREGESVKLNSFGSIGLGSSIVIKCPDGETEANIHSHIYSDKASLQDHLTSIRNKIPISCITYDKNGEEYIKCYKYDYQNQNQLNEDIQQIMDALNNETAYAKLLEKLDKKYKLCEEKL